MFEIKLKNAIVEVLTQFGEEEVQRIKKALKDKDAIASGKLYNSIDFVIKENNLEITLEIVAEDYLKWVDEGRRPGKFPPIRKIQKWISDKRIQPKGGISQKSLGFLIGRKIAKKGIKPKKILNLKQTDLEKRLEEAVRDVIIKEFTEEIQ